MEEWMNEGTNTECRSRINLFSLFYPFIFSKPEKGEKGKEKGKGD